MRILFRLLFIAGMVSLAVSCDKREFKVTDGSSLKGVSISLSDTSARWEAGTSRTVTIVCEPSYARVSKYELKISDAEVFRVLPGERDNIFEVTAVCEGEAEMTAVADGFTDKKNFTVYDDSIKKEDLDVQLHYVDLEEHQSDIQDMQANTVFDAGRRLHLTASSICEAPVYTLKSGDESVVSVEWSENGSWIICTGKPGRCSLVLSVADDCGNVFEYLYDVIVYGHMNLISRCNPVYATGGFMVEEHPYDVKSADIYLSAVVYGCLWNDVSKIVQRTLSPVYGSFALEAGADYTTVLDGSDEFSEINSMYEMDGSQKNWYGVYKIRMDFIVRLDNPYIVIDDVIDDNDREMPDFINFMTVATFSQEGLASFAEPMM